MIFSASSAASTSATSEKKMEHPTASDDKPTDTAAPDPAKTDSGTRKKQSETTLFGNRFTEKEQKDLFLYMVIGIVLIELAITVGAIIFSITNTQMSSTGVPHFKFPWIGYLVSVVMVPVLAMLLVNLVRLGFSRTTEGSTESDPQAMEAIPQKMRTFYALVRGAPTVILFAGFVLMGAGIYYLDGLMAFLLKIGDSFQAVAIWVVGGFAAAWTISYAVRAWLHYKTKQLEAEYLFRQEVLHRTGMVILETKHAPTTELRMIPSSLGMLPSADTPALDIGKLEGAEDVEKEKEEGEEEGDTGERPFTKGSLPRTPTP